MKIRIICLFTVYCNPTFSQTFWGTDQTIAPIYYNLSTIEGNKKYSQDFFKTLKVVRIFKKTLCYLKL
jgi:hypothetical protein